MANISINLLVIRSTDIDRAAAFYALLGIGFEKHRHGAGPLHYAAELDNAVFEICPRKSEKDSTDAVRLGFRVASVEGTVAAVREAGGCIVSAPQHSEWGLRAVIADPKRLCKVVTNVGRWGNGDVEVGPKSLDELPYIMGLIRQSYERQMGDGPQE